MFHHKSVRHEHCYTSNMQTYELVVSVVYYVVADDVYAVLRDEEAIKTEIYLHGPVGATIGLYEGFVLYKSGITYPTPFGARC